MDADICRNDELFGGISRCFSQKSRAPPVEKSHAEQQKQVFQPQIPVEEKAGGYQKIFVDCRTGTQQPPDAENREKEENEAGGNKVQERDVRCFFEGQRKTIIMSYIFKLFLSIFAFVGSVSDLLVEGTSGFVHSLKPQEVNLP